MIVLFRSFLWEAGPGRALVSLGGFLKNSKSLLVLLDASYTRRLWCIIELAAYLKCHEGWSGFASYVLLLSFDFTRKVFPFVLRERKLGSPRKTQDIVVKRCTLESGNSRRAWAASDPNLHGPSGCGHAAPQSPTVPTFFLWKGFPLTSPNKKKKASPQKRESFEINQQKRAGFFF